MKQEETDALAAEQEQLRREALARVQQAEAELDAAKGAVEAWTIRLEAARRDLETHEQPPED